MNRPPPDPMQEPSPGAAPSPPLGTATAGEPRSVSPSRRRRDATAAPRCLAYAACSELLASPHELDPRPALRPRLDAIATLAQARALHPVVVALADADLGDLRQQYSRLFEVGDAGPPVPIRESLRPGRPSGAREQIVRFYDYFDYAPAGPFAWQSDHLSIELEFLHYLAFREADAADEAAALPFQLAQADFAARHAGAWLPAFAQDTAKAAAHSSYAPVVRAVADFVADDLAWQATTLEPRAADR